MKEYLLYLLRWQLSTPLLAFCLISMKTMDTTYSTMIANLLGGCVFFFVDKKIFKKK